MRLLIKGEDNNNNREEEKKKENACKCIKIYTLQAIEILYMTQQIYYRVQI